MPAVLRVCLNAPAPASVAPPPRLQKVHPLAWTAWVAAMALFIHGMASTGLSADRLMRGVPKLATFAARALPPSTERLGPVVQAALETFEMAFVGSLLGAIASLLLAVLAARNTTKHWLLYLAARGIIGIARAVPDIVWALLFILFVGLGPPAGILAIVVDTIGFCGKFFAERIEEVSRQSIEALESTGGSGTAVVAGAVLPACAPSFIATCMFNLEEQVRSATALGVVGAGGIGVELATAMTLFQYDQALTIIIAIFLIVVAVETVSSYLRQRLLGSH